MSDNQQNYLFYAAQLRFVASKTERLTPEISTMMDALETFATRVESGGKFSVDGATAKLTGRALAGVAGFLHQHILPETIASGSSVAERQVRWVIDTSMELTATLTVHAQTAGEGKPCPVVLPAAPET